MDQSGSNFDFLKKIDRFVKTLFVVQHAHRANASLPTILHCLSNNIKKISQSFYYLWEQTIQMVAYIISPETTVSSASSRTISTGGRPTKEYERNTTAAAICRRSYWRHRVVSKLSLTKLIVVWIRGVFQASRRRVRVVL